MFDSYRGTLGIEGSYYLATDTTPSVHIIDADSGQLVYTLSVPPVHGDNTLHLPVSLSEVLAGS